ncbi:EAL domain-containing protein [Motiliproteus sediminis]|uniref:EAL domain-containing protein n=1 Tax=Motiliproteus sediminis TaxID=1468178 RepID=UPI001AEFC8D0|nr:EAL domain-containing protein [Motiliproteus sediminis]
MMQDDSPLIITIDDEESIRRSFCNYLEDYDYRVISAAEGHSGIEMIAQQRPDLVLVDLRMPRCDGLEVLAWIRQHRPEMPVIVVSGTGVVGDVIEALKLGAWDYLLKPVKDLEMLRLSVERALEKAVLQRQARDHQAELEREVARRTEALRRANQQLDIASKAFETHDAILITDPNGRIMRANPAMEQLTGYSQAEMQGQTPRLWHSGLQSEAFYQRMWQRLHATGAWQGELWNRSRDNRLVPVWQSISAVTDDDGKVRYYVGIATDLSELKAKERMLQRRAREEQVLGGLARMSLEQLHTDSFLRSASALMREQLDELSLLDEMLVCQPEGSEPICQELSGTECPHPLPDNRLIQTVLEEGDARQVTLDEGDAKAQLLIPLSSPRHRLGVLVLYAASSLDWPSAHGFFNRLGEVLTLAILQQEAERELQHQATHDSLTELPNRQLLIQLLEQQLKSAIRRDERGALLFFDLDNFKTLNDSLGHSKGDELLHNLGGRIRSILRDEDILARLGGDEFVIVLPPGEMSAEAAANMAKRVAEKVQEVISQPFQLGDNEYLIGASIGAAIYPDGGRSSDDLLKRADSAMYLAKSQGRNSLRFYAPELQQAADRRLYIEHKLRRAIERDELAPFFQPQLDGDAQVVSAEVLMRWYNDEDGWISPAEFIPVAEDTGLIIPISNWLLERVCQRLQAWTDAGLNGTLRGLSINVSPNQFYQPGFAANMLAMLARYQVPAERIILEITEGVVLRNLEEAIAIMSELQNAGLAFSLDDFGTGYSSLAYLKKLPVDELKIDQSFIFEVDKDPDDAKIVDAILSLAGHFGLNVVAEGVETVDAFKLLRSRDCDIYQGFFFSRPLPEAEFLEFLKADRSGFAPD